jgi:hypothetical protein
VSDRGYGLVKVAGRVRKAHVMMWEFYIGKVGAGKELHHECENKRCVNPGHLREVTRKEHIALHPENIMWRNALKGFCKRGHAFSPENTYVRRSGARVCRVCNSLRVREWHAKHAERRGVQVEIRLDGVQ